MITIVHLPIEPFPQRYSEDWLKWYRDASLYPCLGNFQEEFILGEFLYKTIEQGSFLDVTGTLMYKNSQMSRTVKWIKSKLRCQDWSNTVFFFHDLWHPGLVDLFYIRDALGLKFKIAGMLHAGTYDPYDFLAKKKMDRWAAQIEVSWFEEVDKIFVATEYHKNLLLQYRVTDPEKIAVTGFPIYPIIYEDEKHEPDLDVVFPHRLDSEKQPEQFDHMAVNMSRYTFEKTLNLPLTKPEYYQRLRRYKVAVSCALQETWGIAMQECVFAGCLPLVPNRLSYVEMYPEEFRYNTLQEGMLKLVDLIENFHSKKYQVLYEELYNKLMFAGCSAILKQKKELESLCR